MAGTRRSTRQSASTAPKYAESTSESDAPKANGTKTTRRKRAREDEDEDEGGGIDSDGTPPLKKAAKAKSQAPKAPRAKSKASKAVEAASPKPPKTTAPRPPASSESNRDADGNQEVYWLLKAEPLPRFENGVNVAFSIDDLQKCTEPEPWSGVRNPQARNNMQAMREGDLGFFYHSNAKPSGVAGILRIVKEAQVDETAFDPKDPYYDSKSDKEKPKWYCVSVEFVKKFGDVVDLATIKNHAGVGGKLGGMQLVTNSRLSVSRVRKEEWEFIMGLAEGRSENGEQKAA